MPLVPAGKVDKIQWYEDHHEPWTSHSTEIGTTAVAVTDLVSKTADARAAYSAQQVAQEAAKAATLDLKNKVRLMGTAGAAIIKQIRAKGEMTGDNVYVLAQIPAPPTPTPVQPPGQPTAFSVELDATGALMLKWKCNNPAGSQGTFYQVSRRIGASGEFSYLGGSGTRTFVDATVPAGSASVTYQIQAVRSTAVGLPAMFLVNFGTSAGGQMMASVVPVAGGAKLAA